LKIKSARPVPNETAKGFSLLEILVVITIMVVVISISASIFTGSRQDMTEASNTLYDIIQRARTEAVSTNNYVYMGLSQTTSRSPELVVAIVESRDGLASNSNSLTPGNLQLQGKIRVLEGVEINTSEADSGLNNRLSSGLTGTRVELENSAISFPAGTFTRRDDITDGSFDWVIQFSPDGAARLNAEERTVPHYVVLGLVPAADNPANVAGIIIDGPSGAVRIVRPGDAEDRNND